MNTEITMKQNPSRRMNIDITIGKRLKGHGGKIMKNQEFYKIEKNGMSYMTLLININLKVFQKVKVWLNL